MSLNCEPFGTELAWIDDTQLYPVYVEPFQEFIFLKLFIEDRKKTMHVRFSSHYFVLATALGTSPTNKA